MSGFVVEYGRSDQNNVEAMFEKISHRGTYASEIYENEGVTMAQNYNRADCPDAGKEVEIPVPSYRDENLRICYDGQMGNADELGLSHGISDDPFKEERLILHLYEQHRGNMLHHLDDSIFAFVISNGDKFFAARDVLGIKTLYYGREDQTLYLTSELKSILEVTEDVHEFPPGHYMDHHGQLTQFSALPKTPPKYFHSDLDRIMDNIRNIIRRSILTRVDFHVPVGCLLSGGIDSSVVTYLASKVYSEMFGDGTRLKTFALGVNEDSKDVQNARVMANFLNTNHHELIVSTEQMLAVLPDVIYYLESFDPSLVRSAVANFLISQYAYNHGIQTLLSGEGGDEVFCGYEYLKDFPIEELFERQMECMGFLHNNAALRLDRMNQCNGIRVVAPLISGELLEYSLAIPPKYKQKQDGNNRIEKWVFRKAFESLLPKRIVWRLKQEFSQGSGSASTLTDHFDYLITDSELSDAQVEYPMIRSKEELYYFRIFTRHFGTDNAVKTVGQWLSL